MHQATRYPGISIQNIPLINLREEFGELRRRFADPIFLQQLRAWKPGDGIEVPYMTWFGYRHDLYTLLLQRAILGLEAYLSGAVMGELGRTGRLTSDLAAYASNPFAIPGRGGTAKRFYVLLPRLVSDSIALDVMHPEVWDEIEDFYRAIRNPLFHGGQITSDAAETLNEPIRLIDAVYGWVDSWHDLFHFLRVPIDEPTQRADDRNEDANGKVKVSINFKVGKF